MIELDVDGTSLQILYRDDDLIAINKPAGLLVHRSEIDRHETRFAIQLLRDQIGRRVYPVHRLDKPTAGVLLFALSSDAARRLQNLFERNMVQKTYVAVVRGYVDERGVIDYPLKEELDKMTDRRARQDKAAQEAVTEYQCLATAELPYPVGRYDTARYSLLQVRPRTGRKHQIRRHMKHIFHPVVGDTTHGDGKQNQFFRDHFGCHRLLLAATELQLMHPLGNEPLSIHAPVDEKFQNIIRALGWDGIF